MIALRRAGRLVAWAVIAVLAAALLAAWMVPQAAGWTALTVRSGSMTPTYPVGSQVVVASVMGEEEQLKLDDTISFRPRAGDSDVITHRIVAKTYRNDGEVVFTTRGDANNADDPWQVTSPQILGKVEYHIPYVGYVASWLPPKAKGAGVLALALGLLGYGAWQLVQSGKVRGRTGSVAGRHRAMP